MCPSTDTFKSPTLDDYRRFHGMWCGLSTAQRCIDSFTGRILFMPVDYTADTLTSHDFTRTNPSFWNRLTILGYCWLVGISGTGLSTALGLTETVLAEDELNQPMQEKLVLEQYPCLACHPCVLDHLGGSVVLLRQFYFRFVGLQVVMWHFIDPQTGDLHLVEVYELQSAVLRCGWRLWEALRGRLAAFHRKGKLE